MGNRGFFEQKWPKKHEYVVEECLAVRVSELMRRDGRPYHPSYGELPLVEKRHGAVRRYYFLCPSCSRVCEALFRPPYPFGDKRLLKDWRYDIGQAGFACRRCYGLVYASQRYGRNHPLRQIPPPRLRLSRQRRLARAERGLQMLAQLSVRV